MKKEVIVLSLGGSLIIPNEIDTKFLKQFKEVILRNTKEHKFVIVCGGGSTARKYIRGLDKEKINKKKFLQGLLGVSTTRLNARFMTYFFGEDANQGIPHNMKEIKNLLRFNPVVFCGALRYAKDETSDATSAKLANYFKAPFINLTNVKGLYDKNPKTEKISKRRFSVPGNSKKEQKNSREYKNAKFIPEISWKDFDKMANKFVFKPGQNFVLDQTASKTIQKNKIKTYIIGKDLKQLENLLKGKKFIGTIIEG